MSVQTNPPPPSSKPPPGLRAIVLRASAYEFLALGFQHSIRLAGNLILTRALFPGAFGMAALVSIYNQGLVMLSDVGVAQGVIQSPRGDDVDFLNTAWTIQILRGVAICIAGLLLAWPMAQFYQTPELVPLLMFGSTTPLINSFASTSLLTLTRRVDSRRITTIDVIGQMAGMATMIPLALATGSVWSLLAGTTVSSLMKVILSHLQPVGYRNRLFRSPEASQSIVRFGRWILFSSALTFLAQQTDRMLLGKLLGLTELGIFSVAITFVELGDMVIQRLSQQILFPVLSKISHEQPQRLREVYYRARRGLDRVLMPTFGFGAAVAPWLISFLYDARYEAAGWMCQVLSARLLLAGIAIPTEKCLLACGAPHFGFQRSLSRILWLVAALPIGFHFGHLRGLIWATALMDLPALGLLLPALHSRGLFSARREIMAVLLFTVTMSLVTVAARLF